MEDFIVAMLNMIGGGGAGSIATGMLSQGPETWNPALYQLAVNVHDVAVKPLTSVVLAVVFTLELARNSTRIESDRELGVKIVAGTLFKVALVFLAVQNAGLFLRAFDSATQFLMQGASSQLSFDTAGDGGQLGDLMREQVKDAGMMGQAALFFLLAIPWLVSQLAAVVFTVVLYIRFIELYALTAFQSLPFALLVHEDTRPVGVGYFKAYARTSLTTLEHLLIPRGLKSAGLTADRALAGYGIVHGMALPVVLFPSCLLYALADLLVPELTTAQVSGRCGDIRRLVRTLLYRCLLFACGTAVLLLAFSGPLGRLIYHSDDAGRFIRLLAPLVPVMYLDTVTDGCLRGLGQQTRCMAINVFDATLGVVLVWALLPRFGLAGYLFILYFNECVNFTLSFTLLRRTVRRCCADEKPPAG